MLKKAMHGFALFVSLALSASALAKGVTITIACGAVGQELEMCRKNAEAWAKETGNSVRLFQSPNMTNDRLGLFQQMFSAKSPEIDVLQVDVIWPGLLGRHFIDLNPHFPKEHVRRHFPAIVANNTDGEGRLLAVPFFTDAGLLYYRKDLLEKYKQKAPTTWAELMETARLVVEKEKAANPKLVGFVFQGKAYEGLTCNALEWIDSYGGGTIIDEKSGEVTVNNPKAKQALEMAASWVGGISSKSVLNYDEEAARGAFQSGNAVFMRNWPYAWALVNEKASPVSGKVGVVALPKGGASGKHTGALGGWNLAVSKYSRYPKEAASLVQYMTTQKIQIERAIEGSFNPTISDAYKDKALLEANPFFGDLFQTFVTAVARPARVTGQQYNQVSFKFWNTTHSILSGGAKPDQALKKLEDELNRLKRRGWK